jgi:DNA-binding transcriptional regulator YdaS (Cro superfamily)
MPVGHLDASVQTALAGGEELASKWIAVQPQVVNKGAQALLDECVGPSQDALAMAPATGARQPQALRPAIVPSVAQSDRLMESIEARELELGARRVRLAPTRELD